MNLPEQPATFKAAEEPEQPWRWRLESADGTVLDAPADQPELAGQTFATQADAESWVGEIWADLAAAGVDAVTLIEHDRVVYGPMSLHA